MEARVLDGDSELRGERSHQRELVRRQGAPAGRIDGEQADQVLADAKGQPDGGLDPGFCELLAN